MSKSHKVLVLTDHSGHSDQNSIYSLLREMVSHTQCASLDVASRGLSINEAFFKDNDADALHVARIDKHFAYTEDGAAYTANLKSADVTSYDFVFMRLPRPISDDYILWIEETFSNAVIVNRPSGIIKTSTKAFLLNFPSVCAEMKLCYSVSDVMEMVNRYPIVLKPLKEYGGRGLLKIDRAHIDDGIELHDTAAYLLSISDQIASDGYLAMKYLKNVSEGDKRILVVNGKIMASSLRLPKEGSWLCNVAQGGKSVSTEVTEREKEIIATISPVLIENGIVIFGADTLVDDDGSRVLSEINTLSIGGFPQAQKQSGLPIIKDTINKLFEYADGQSE